MGDNNQKSKPARATARPAITPPGRVLSRTAHGPAGPADPPADLVTRFRQALHLSADVPPPQVFAEALARLEGR